MAKLEKIEAPFPRIRYDDAVQMLPDGTRMACWKITSSTAATSARRTRLISLRSSTVRSWCIAIRRREGVLHGARPRAPELALCVDVLAPEGYGEIIGGSQRMASFDLLMQRIQEHGRPKRPSSGISICASMAGFRTPVSAWALSAPWPGSAAWSMCARRFRSRACCTGCIRREAQGLRGLAACEERTGAASRMPQSTQTLPAKSRVLAAPGMTNFLNVCVC